MWIRLSLLACVCYTMYSMGINHVRKLSPTLSMTRHVLMVLATTGLLSAVLLAALHSRSRQHRDTVGNARRQAAIVVGMAVLLLVIQLCLAYTIDNAPNPAYSHVIVNCSVLLVLLWAWMAYNKHISARGAGGAVLSMVGVALVMTA